MGISLSPASSPAIASPVACCHQLSVASSYMTRLLKRSAPLVRNTGADTPARRSKTEAAFDSGE